MSKKYRAIIIPGAKKSGTTTVYDILTKHSQISKSKIKETDFFILNPEEIKKNKKKYENNFLEKNKKIIDASVGYFSNKATIKKIKKYFKKEPKVIIILRDPVKRIFSNYIHYIKITPKKEKRNFDKLLNEIKGPEFKKIIKSENDFLKKSVKQKKIIYRHDIDNKIEKKLRKYYNVKLFPVNANIKGPKFKYFQGSLYSKNVTLWEKNFKHVKIIFFEELIENPKKIIKELLKFLELKEEKKVLKLPHSNKTKIPTRTGRKVKIFAQKYFPIQLIKKLKNVIPEKIFYKKTPKITKEQYKKTKQILKKEYDYWYKKHPRLKKYWKY